LGIHEEERLGVVGAIQDLTEDAAASALFCDTLQPGVGPPMGKSLEISHRQVIGAGQMGKKQRCDRDYRGPKQSNFK
jgi:hypothetical protein